MTGRGVAEWRRRGIGGCADQTFDVQVENNLDDTHRKGTGTEWFTTSTVGFIGHHVGKVWGGSFRFTPVNIPAGARIDVAYIDSYAAAGGDTTGVNSNIYMEDADDPAAPTSYTEFDTQAGAVTTAFTAWDDAAMVEQEFNQSPSIVDVVQEIVDRGGWASSQAMQVFWLDDTSDTNMAYWIVTHNSGDGSNAMKLHVEYCA